jgi:hypothetical protein
MARLSGEVLRERVEEGEEPDVSGAGRGSAGFLLGTASATCALITLDTNFVAVSLPSIARSFHSGFADTEIACVRHLIAQFGLDIHLIV